VLDGTPLWPDLLKHRAMIVLHFIKKLDLSVFASDPLRDAGAQLIAEGLRHNKVLTYLDVSGQQIMEKGAETLAYALVNRSSLETFIIGTNKLGVATSTYAEVLRASTCALKTLDMSDTGMGDMDGVKIAGGLARNDSLEVLRIERNDLSSDGGLAIGEMLLLNLNLHSLYIGRNDIGRSVGSIVYASKLNPTLKTLSVQGNKLGVLGAESISKFYDDPEQPSIRELNMRHCSLNSSGVVQMFGAVSCRSQLRVLNLAWTQVGSLGGQTIATVLLSPDCVLEELDLRDNQLGDSGAFAKKLHQLQAANATNSSLQRLHLGNNGLDVESVQPLASALAGFLALTDLAFYGNPIGPDGATHFANIVQFRKCQNLSNLNLAMCDIGERGGRAMADAMVRHAMDNNPTVKVINLSQNSLTDKFINSIAPLISTHGTTHRTLDEIDLSFNAIHHRGIHALEEAKKGQPSDGVRIHLHANPGAAYIREHGIQLHPDLLL
jgi:Ran GTPase-activating protein (RanGAP) involved in mRNA processing and transport